MKEQKFINNVISFKVKNRKKSILGYLIQYNQDWTLLRHIPVDYVLDGFILIPNSNILEFQRNSDVKWI
ncbi:hypothetical protein ND863_20185, partial [Leptospira kanakyensis]|nr:hypothetical protein [Leptospira kanakyensis]